MPDDGRWQNKVIDHNVAVLYINSQISTSIN